MPENFGDILNENRLENNLTMRKLAEKMGWVPSFVAELENGNRLPPKDLTVIEKLAKFINVDSKQLLILAQRERVKPQEDEDVMKFFRTKGDLAFTLCREAEGISDQVLETIIENLRKEKKGKNT